MEILKGLIRIIDRISTLGGIVSFAALIFFVLLNSVEIAMRTFINKSLLVTDEFSGWLLVWMAFMGMGWTLREDGHIQIDIIIRKLSERVKIYVNIIFHAISVSILIFFTVFALEFLIETYSRNVKGVSVIKFPLCYPIMGMVFGSIILTLQFFAGLLKNILKIKKNYVK